MTIVFVYSFLECCASWGIEGGEASLIKKYDEVFGNYERTTMDVNGYYTYENTGQNNDQNEKLVLFHSKTKGWRVKTINN